MAEPIRHGEAMKGQEDGDSRLMVNGVAHDERQFARECGPSNDRFPVRCDHRADTNRLVERACGPALKGGLEAENLLKRGTRFCFDCCAALTMVVGQHSGRTSG